MPRERGVHGGGAGLRRAGNEEVWQRHGLSRGFTSLSWGSRNLLYLS
jgi:hypothetical protein